MQGATTWKTMMKDWSSRREEEDSIDGLMELLTMTELQTKRKLADSRPLACHVYDGKSIDMTGDCMKLRQGNRKHEHHHPLLTNISTGNSPGKSQDYISEVSLVKGPQLVHSMGEACYSQFRFPAIIPPGHKLTSNCTTAALVSSSCCRSWSYEILDVPKPVAADWALWTISTVSANSFHSAACFKHSRAGQTSQSPAGWKHRGMHCLSWSLKDYFHFPTTWCMTCKRSFRRQETWFNPLS